MRYVTDPTHILKICPSSCQTSKSLTRTYTTHTMEDEKRRVTKFSPLPRKIRVTLLIAPGSFAEHNYQLNACLTMSLATDSTQAFSISNQTTIVLS